ncbi:unnamed protein product [marine sediment metagenome]|uniref:Uncharacterized protein n=1 Tax=marine sediment metagenome TaxID=412755 RepID=X0ZQW0_9ZZZZ
MTTTNDGGPAFPFTIYDGSGTPLSIEGMTLRDAIALQALNKSTWNWALSGKAELLDSARSCYEMADAMLKARDET